jgi:hypothetical protein
MNTDGSRLMWKPLELTPERKIETTKDTKVHENQRVENLTALTFQMWMRLPSRG